MVIRSQTFEVFRSDERGFTHWPSSRVIPQPHLASNSMHPPTAAGVSRENQILGVLHVQNTLKYIDAHRGENPRRL